PHAENEQDCRTNGVRSAGSSLGAASAAIAAATAALYGPLHGGAKEAVLRMLGQIGCKKSVADFLQKVKRGEGRLMGFGHRIYKSYDPRARIIKQMADQVFGVMGRNPL